MHVCHDRLRGLLLIGDPHIEARTPGFRRDDYAETILGKLAWALDFAQLHQLLPIMLGDIFEKPRDNPNWLIVRLLDLMGNRAIPTIFGNHDCANPHLDENDSLTLLERAGAVRILSPTRLWSCAIDGREIIVGGSSYRYRIPDSLVLPKNGKSLPSSPEGDAASSKLVLWLTHHDLVFPNENEAVVTSFQEIPGIDYVINGHIHRRSSAMVVRGQTTWVNPGNIARRSRSDSTRGSAPGVLRMDIASDGQWLHYIDVPHRPASEVFYETAAIEAAEVGYSSFVTGLSTLQSRKTNAGDGLMEFLSKNAAQFEPDVATEIFKLAECVLNDGKEDDT